MSLRSHPSRKKRFTTISTKALKAEVQSSLKLASKLGKAKKNLYKEIVSI